MISPITTRILRKDLDYFLDRFRQDIDFLLRVVEGKRSARSRGNLETLHDWLRAMMAGANGDALLIEDSANVVRMNIVDRERDHTQFFFRRADDAYAFNRQQPLRRVVQQVMLVSRGFLATDDVQIINRRAQTNLGSNRGRAR